MANKKASKKTAAASGNNPRAASIAGVRSKIDRLDQQLVKLMNNRASLALEIGKLKSESGVSAYAPSREDEVLSRVLGLNKGPLAERSVRAIFRELISGSRSLEKNLRVAYLGPAYSYSHLAAIHRFGQSVELVPVGNIAGVFEEINRRHADFGVVLPPRAVPRRCRGRRRPRRHLRLANPTRHSTSPCPKASLPRRSSREARRGP